MPTAIDPEKGLEKALKKSKKLWKPSKDRGWSFYCPLCRAQRKLAYEPKPEKPRHFFQIALTTLVFTLATWHWWEWKGFVSFIPFWMIFEAGFRTKVRAQLPCPHCGFDAYLYLTDRSRARKEVETYWKKKFAEKGIPYPGESAGEEKAAKGHESLDRAKSSNPLDSSPSGMSDQIEDEFVDTDSTAS